MLRDQAQHTVCGVIYTAMMRGEIKVSVSSYFLYRLSAEFGGRGSFAGKAVTARELGCLQQPSVRMSTLSRVESMK